MEQFHFPRWTNRLKLALGAGLLCGPAYVVLLIAFGASPKTISVGYEPEQPVPFSHARHAGDLGLDCRYCHTTVESAARAAIPHSNVCMNCHKQVLRSDPKLEMVVKAHETGEPIPWVRVHDLPDYVYFNHSAHVKRGVGCKSCHGRVDQMDVVRQVETLSMGWCLECHRSPDKHLRPLDQITNMVWEPESAIVDALRKPYLDLEEKLAEKIEALTGSEDEDEDEDAEPKKLTEEQQADLDLAKSTTRTNVNAIKLKIRSTVEARLEEAAIKQGKKIKAKYQVKPSEDCTTCHR